LFGGEDAFDVGREILHKLTGDVSGGVGYGCGETALLTNLIESGEESVGANEEVFVFLGTVLQAVDENGSGEAGVLENAAADESGDFARRRRIREIFAGDTAGLGEFSLLVPAAQTIKFVAADFDVEVAHGDEVRKSSDFILRGENDVGGADGIGETEFFELGETFGEQKFLVAVDAGMGDRLVEGNFRGPLGDGVFALAAFVETDVHGVDFVEEIGGALDEKVGEAGRGASVDEGGAMLGFELVGVAELLGSERVAGQVGAQVEIARTQAERGAENDFVEDGSGGIDDEVAALGGANDAVKIAGIDFSDGDGGFLAEEAAGTGGVAVATPDIVALAFEKLGKKGAGQTRSEDKDSHAVRQLYHRDLVAGVGLDLRFRGNQAAYVRSHHFPSQNRTVAKPRDGECWS
jgi:hypothetical protein